jgi:hypothetical protein
MKKTTTISRIDNSRLKHGIAKSILALLLLFGAMSVNAQRTASVSGNWNSTATWGGQSVPTSGTVTINAGITVTVTAAAAATNVTNNGTLFMNGGSLTIANGGSYTANSGSSTAFNATNVITGGGGGNNGVLVTINAGAGITTANVAGVNSSFTQNAGNKGEVFNAAANYTFNGSASQTANLINTTINNLTISNTAGSVTLNAATSVDGNLLINNGGGSLTGGALSHTVTGSWTNNGTYVPGTSTITLDGTSQTIGGSATTIFNNLSLANGTKTFGIATTINGKLTIPSGAFANFGSITTHTAGTLTLGTLGTGAAKFGSTSTSATAPVFKNNTYFTAGTTGFITVGTSSCTAPTITLSSIPSVCPGVVSYSIPYTAVTGGADLYSISGTGITSVSNGTLNAPSSSIAVGLSSPAVTGTISPSAFTVSSSVTGCVSSNLSGSVTVLNNVGTPNFTVGATTVCQDAANTTYTATATNSTGITYSVSPVGAGTIGSSSGIMDWNPSFSGTATITASAAGCNGPQTGDRIVIVTPTVGTPSFTLGATTVCQNAADETYTATATDATAITYTVLPGTAGTIGSSTGIMNWSATFSGTATITASAAGCNGPKTANRVVTVTPTVGTPSFTLGATTVCQDSVDTTYTATATNSTGIAYSVSPVGAGTIDSSTGVMDWNASFSGTATITASATGCNGPSTANRIVTVTPTVGTPSFTIGATSSVCQDAANTTYTATATNATGITYSVSPSAAGTIGLNTGVMNWDPTFSGAATITASAAGCNGPLTGDTVVTVVPTVATPSFNAGATSVCIDAADETYIATANYTTGITYSVSPSAAGIIGLNTGVMNWDANFTGTATITASAAGCNGPVTANRVVTVNALPIVTASDVSGCSGTPIALIGSSTPIGGSGNFSVANPYVGTSSTTYTYTYTDLNGCSATSASANITITAQPIWYFDADGDQYYDEAGISSCTSPGPGFTTSVLGGGDCDNTNGTIYPGAPEICYNNILENCTGTLSQGCAPVVVNMNPSYNNSVLPSLSVAIAAMPYTYGSYTNLKYRFSITNLTTNTTAPDIIQTSRFVTIPASIHSYNAQYTITASAVINEEIVPFAGNTVTVNSPSVQQISLSTASCGATLAALTSTVSANAGLNATGYTFRIRLNDANPTPTYATSSSSTRFISANSFTGFPLQYATSYKVSVQYSFIDPITNLPTQSGYGAECTINTPSIPFTNLASPLCGSTVSTLTANISAAAAPYATGYQFRVRLFSDNGPTPTYYYTPQLSGRFSSLSAFQGLSLAYGTAYSVSVQYSILSGATTVWSGYGAECKVTTPAAPPAKTAIESEYPFKAIAYPNPFANNFMLDVKTTSESSVNIKVYDMIGRMIDQKNVRISDMETTTIGDQYPTGVYNLVVTQEDSVQTLRVIKR